MSDNNREAPGSREQPKKRKTDGRQEKVSSGNVLGGWGQESKKKARGSGWGQNSSTGWGQSLSKGWGQNLSTGWGQNSSKGWGQNSSTGWGQNSSTGWGQQEAKKKGTGWGQQEAKKVEHGKKAVEEVAVGDGKVAFVLDRRGGIDRDEEQEKKVVKKVWTWVGAMKEKEQERKNLEESGAPDYGDDSSGDKKRKDYDCTNLNHFKKVTEEGLSFCLEEAVKYWNDPMYTKYQMQCPCEWVRKHVSLPDFSFVCY